MHRPCKVPIILKYVQIFFDLWFKFQVMVSGLGFSKVFINFGLGH